MWPRRTQYKFKSKVASESQESVCQGYWMLKVKSSMRCKISRKDSVYNKPR